MQRVNDVTTSETWFNSQNPRILHFQIILHSYSVPIQKFRTNANRNPVYWTRVNVNPACTQNASEQRKKWTGTGMDIRTQQRSQRPVKNVGHKRAGPFLFSLRIARMHHAEPSCSPFTGEPCLWKWWPPRRRRKAKAYRGGICVQRYLFPHPPAYIGLSLIREGTHTHTHGLSPISFSSFLRLPLLETRSTAPSLLRVSPLALIQPTYVAYIYVSTGEERFSNILTQKYTVHIRILEYTRG